MSVLACDRSGCEAIMCDFYSNAFGYICYHCLEELSNTYPTTVVDIQIFMNTPKREPGFFVNSLDVYEIFERRY